MRFYYQIPYTYCVSQKVNIFALRTTLFQKTHIVFSQKMGAQFYSIAKHLITTTNYNFIIKTLRIRPTYTSRAKPGCIHPLICDFLISNTKFYSISYEYLCKTIHCSQKCTYEKLYHALPCGSNKFTQLMKWSMVRSHRKKTGNLGLVEIMTTTQQINSLSMAWATTHTAAPEHVLDLLSRLRTQVNLRNGLDTGCGKIFR